MSATHKSAEKIKRSAKQKLQRVSSQTILERGRVSVPPLTVFTLAIYSNNRDFKNQRRGRQRERHKNNRFNKQNNNFARASHFFVHFLPVFARLRRENA